MLPARDERGEQRLGRRMEAPVNELSAAQDRQMLGRQPLIDPRGFVVAVPGERQRINVS